MKYEIIEYDRKYQEDVINLLIEVCVEEHQLKEYEQDLIKHVKAEEFIKSWVILDEGKVIATICYTERTPKNAEIKKVYIKKEYRRKGLGTKMMEFVVNEIKSKNYDSIYVGTSDHFENAIKFYKKYGFEFVCEEGNGYLFELKLNKEEK